MRTELRCKTCQTKLAVKIELQGKAVRCPKCRNPVKVALAPVVLPQLGNRQAVQTPLMAVPLDDEPMPAEVLPASPRVEDYEVLPDDEEPITLSRPERYDTPSPVESDGEAQAKPKKKKKKKKKNALLDDSTKIPVWMWIAGGVGAMIATGGVIFGIILALRTHTPDGEPVDWRGFALEFIILVPINVVILIAGMFISSALGGGINFGDAKTAIIGSFFLVVVVVLVSLIPVFGRYLTLIVWLIGFMTIFGLDAWEARFLLLICWLLSFAGNMAYAHIENRMMEKRLEREEREERDDDERRKIRWPREKEPNNDPDEQGYFRPGDWHQRMGNWVEAQRRTCLT